MKLGIVALIKKNFIFVQKYMLCYIKIRRILSGLWICKSYSIMGKLHFNQFCSITAGCDFIDQLLHTSFCSFSFNWINSNHMIYTQMVFCPLTVNTNSLRTWIDIFVQYSLEEGNQPFTYWSSGQVWGSNLQIAKMKEMIKLRTVGWNQESIVAEIDWRLGKSRILWSQKN